MIHESRHPADPRVIKSCLQCGYNLAGLPEHRCPECGRVFDPADPTSFGGLARSRPTSFLIRPTLMLVTVLASVFVGVLLSTACPGKGRGSPWMLVTVPLCVLGGTVLFNSSLPLKVGEVLITTLGLQFAILGIASLSGAGPDPVTLVFGNAFVLPPLCVGVGLGTSLYRRWGDGID